MSFFKWLIAGVVGATIGGAVWVAIGYLANSEVGYIAWGIGFLAGLGVRMVVDDDQVGTLSGVTAILASLGVILVSKYLVVSLLVNNLMAEIDLNAMPSQVDMIVDIADDVVDEWEDEGKQINWPAGMTMEDATSQVDYPPDVWAEATKRWNAIPADQQQENIEQNAAVRRQMAELLAGNVKDEAFKDSFNGFDLLWFGLAAFTAFRIAGGGSDDD